VNDLYHSYPVAQQTHLLISVKFLPLTLIASVVQLSSMPRETNDAPRDTNVSDPLSVYKRFGQMFVMRVDVALSPSLYLCVCLVTLSRQTS